MAARKHSTVSLSRLTREDLRTLRGALSINDIELMAEDIDGADPSTVEQRRRIAALTRKIDAAEDLLDGREEHYAEGLDSPEGMRYLERTA